MKKQGALRGALILAVSGFVVKVLGALFKIPLGSLLGPEGNGIFSIAYNIYALIFVISTAGLPVAMSKVVSEVEAGGKNSKVILKKALAIFAPLGFALGLVLFFASPLLARLMGAESAMLSIRAVTPAIFFVSVSAVLRGFFQGHSNMLPTAVSEIIEAASKLVFGIGALYFLMGKGYGNDVLAAGAIIGVTAGTAISMVYLTVKKRGVLCTHKPSPDGGTVTRLIKTAIPITMGAGVVALGSVLDSGIVVNVLVCGGETSRRALWLFGSYNYAATVFNLPGFLITTLGISLVPTVSGACALGKYKEMSSLCENVMKLTLSAACAAAGGMFVLSDPILKILYGGVGADAVLVSARLLKALSLAVPLLALSSVSAALLQALGDAKKTMYGMCIGAAVKVFLNFLLVGIEGIGIYGAAISTVVCYGITCAFNLWFLSKNQRVALRFSKILVLPTLLGLFPTLFVGVVYSVIAPRTQVLISVAVTAVCGFLLWGACIMLFRMVKVVDINRLFSRKDITIFEKNHQIIKKL